MTTHVAFARHHQEWLTSLLGAGIPSEAEATCASCAMCDKSGSAGGQLAFNEATKCCTYWPTIPNYLVGDILNEPEASEGRRRMSSLVEGPNAWPLGVGPPKDYLDAYDRRKDQEFGRAVDLLCPLYSTSTGGCTIWAHRNGVCSTWFCKTRRGKLSQDFWEACQTLLLSVERHVATWCAMQMDVDLRRLAVDTTGASKYVVPRLLSVGGKQETAPDPPSVWGKWHSSRHEYYRECARLVGDLRWNDVQSIGGVSLRLQASAASHAFAAMSDYRLPERLISVGLRQVEPLQDAVRVSTYKAIDPQLVSQSLFALLHYFDGQPVGDVLARIKDLEGIDVPPSLLQRLTDFGILASAPLSDADTKQASSV